MDSSKDLDILQTFESESPIATELRRIYHNMKGTENGGTRNKSFLVTSATRGEGKSTVCSYLALTIAQYPQRKVLVVDADMRRPRVHKIFGVPNTSGLMECLSDAVDPMTTVKKTQIPNLDIIPSGQYPDAPSRLFESEGLSDFFDKVKFYYDIVLVDSAPVLAVSDTLFLCSEVEAVLYVLLAGITPQDVIFRATNVLSDSKANVIGAIVNNASEVLPYHYDYKYYGYEPKK